MLLKGMKCSLTSLDAWALMAEACRNAQHSIDFEQYIVHDDSVGRPFLEELARRAREGLRVRVILDDFGSRQMNQSPLLDDLRTAGVAVVFYRPLRFWRFVWPLASLPRTHSKLLYIDGDQGYVGSMCMAEHMRDWRDTQLFVTGEAVIEAQRDFERLWHELTLGTPVPKAFNADPVDYMAHDPDAKSFPIYEALLAEIERATRHIRLATPYFFPPRRLRDALWRARNRGVQISLLLSHKTDVPIADKAARAMYEWWQRLGFEVHLYEPVVMHAKYAVIDDRWATVGSCNYDILSLKCNREANFTLYDPLDVAVIAGHFDGDLTKCRAPTKADFTRQSFVDRWTGRLCALILKAL